MATWAAIQTATNICDNIVAVPTGVIYPAPPEHYAVNIDGLGVGIGWYYDQATNVWTGPPSITASFSPAPIFLGQTTTLLWQSQNVETVTIDGQSYAPNDSKDYTPSSAGTEGRGGRPRGSARALPPTRPACGRSRRR